MQMKTAKYALAGALLIIALIPASHAAVDFDLLKGLELDWYFEYDPDTWDVDEAIGYFHDYNGDGIQDYLIHQSNHTNKDRIFCLNAANDADPKQYPADAVASREFSWTDGTFIPGNLHLVKPDSEKRTPDLVFTGKDKKTNYTKYVFYRLNETNTSYPTEKTWSITAQADLNPVLIWPSASFNSDDYPDFFIYNSKLNTSGKFVIGCYNGLDGSVIWTRNVDKSGDDPGTPAFPGMPEPYLTLNVLPNVVGSGRSGDFDADGKPEIALYYTFTLFEMSKSKVGFSTRGNVIVLKGSNGTNYSSTPSWWELYNYPIMNALPFMCTWDYNKDTYIDLQIMRMIIFNPEAVPILKVYDLKNAAILFQTTNADFGQSFTEWEYYMTMPVWSRTGSLLDMNGDSWFDIVAYRPMGMSGMNVRYALANGYAGGGSSKGRTIWLQDAGSYEQCIYPVNDWNGDNIMDPALCLHPAAPVSGKLDWEFSLHNIELSNPTFQKSFVYSMDYAGPWNPAEDSLTTGMVMISGVGDIDGDSQEDTYASVSFGIDNGDDGEIDESYGRIFVFDNTPGATPPDITAEFQVAYTGEDIVPMCFLNFDYDMGREEFVDQNKDGSFNDIIITSPMAIYSLSFTYKPVAPVTPGDIIAVLLGKEEIPQGQFDNYDTNDDGKVDIADVIWLLTHQV